MCRPAGIIHGATQDGCSTFSNCDDSPVNIFPESRRSVEVEFYLIATHYKMYVFSYVINFSIPSRELVYIYKVIACSYVDAFVVL